MCRQLGFYFVVLFFTCCSAAEVNSVCGEDSGFNGICRYVVDCPIAVESIRKTHTHNLERCGFEGFDEIVCCPPQTTRGPTSTVDVTTSSEEMSPDTGPDQQNRFPKRKCEQACQELSNDVKTSLVHFNIVNGEDANITEFPHMAALGYDSDEGIDWRCGASVISKRYLLTAAHCIANIGRQLPKKARLGVSTLTDLNPIDVSVQNVSVNPTYNPSTKHNDIALVELAEDLTFSEFIYPACLYMDNDDPPGLMATGWGQTVNGIEDTRSVILQKANLQAISLQKCNESYIKRTSGSKYILETQLCAGSNGSDACRGDSGGPLQIQNKAGSYSIVGVISYGAGCGGRIPGVYTRVSKYLDWIEKLVWP